MSNFFDSVGYQSNITSPSAYEAQGMGYFTGGGISLHNGSRQISFAHVDMPSVDASCTGIDLWLGGFSFIDGSELVSMGKQVLAGAAGYLFQLAMQTELPNVTKALNVMQDAVRAINNMSMNTCQMGQDLAMSVPWKLQGMHNQICKTLGSKTGAFADFASGIQHCKDEGTNSGINNQASKTKGMESQTNENIVWKYLSEKGGFLDTETKELFMTISGTVIFDARGNMTTVQPQVNQSVVDGLLQGKPIKNALKCQGAANCLKVDHGTIDLTTSDGFIAKVETYLSEIQTAVAQDDRPLSAKEKSFLAMTHLPVLKMIETSLSAGIAINTADYAQIIANDIVTSYLQSIIDYVRSTVPLKYSDTVNQYMENSYLMVNRLIAQRQTKLYQQIAAMQQVIQSYVFLQKQVTAQMSSGLRQNISF
jgi:conjugative transfer pilus assembly protein TraH